VYKISFWVYIPKIYSFPVDSNAIKSIGCTTSYNSLTSLGCLKEISPLSKNKLLSFDGWHYLSWIIRPTCIQRYLNIGVFKPSLWGTENFHSGQKNNYANLFYFIDNVSIEPYTGNTNSDNAISYCNYSQNSSYSFMNSTFKSRFNSGDSIPLSYSSLDSLVTRAIQNPKEAYFVAGHTDNEGGNHLKLSKQRVNQVLTYLKSKGVSPLRFVKGYMGASSPEHENETEAGKALNRQVVISNLDKNGYSVAMYRNALECFKNNNLQDAFKFLNLWEANCESKYKTPTIFDPAIKKYKKDVRYRKIYNKIITNHYKRFKLPKLAYELDSLYFEDQSARELPLYLEELSGVWTGTDTIQRSFPSMDVITDSLRSEALILKIKNIINKHGLPKLSEVGKRAAKSSLVILAHAYKHHADYIENLLPSIKDLCTIGEIDWDYYAIIYDKWCILKNKPQHYGTQYRLVNGKEQIVECDATIEEINKRRYVMGLFELTN
jgi:outer membrane protein OmpA-like peptidoglycan-associated protein